MAPKKVVRVSRQGFTKCPGCGTHIKVAPKVAETVCAFCGARLLDALQRSASPLERVVSRGRGGLVAGALLGLSLAPGCTSDGTPQDDDGGDIAAEVTTDATGDTGQPDTDEDTGTPDVLIDTADDLGPQPEYGLPPDILEDTTPPDAVDDTLPQPMYGLPADAGQLDVTTDVVDDWVPQPEYGLPADIIEPDASDHDAKDAGATDADADSELPPITPLYGIPPQPE